MNPVSVACWTAEGHAIMLAKTFNLQIANSYAPHVTTTIMQQFRCFAVLHPPQALDPRLLALAGLGCVNSQSLFGGTHGSLVSHAFGWSSCSNYKVEVRSSNLLPDMSFLLNLSLSGCRSEGHASCWLILESPGPSERRLHSASHVALATRIWHEQSLRIPVAHAREFVGNKRAARLHSLNAVIAALQHAAAWRARNARRAQVKSDGSACTR